MLIYIKMIKVNYISWYVFTNSKVKFINCTPTKNFSYMRAKYFTIPFDIRSIFWSNSPISCNIWWLQFPLKLENMTGIFLCSTTISITTLVTCHLTMISYIKTFFVYNIWHLSHLSAISKFLSFSSFHDELFS